MTGPAVRSRADLLADLVSDRIDRDGLGPGDPIGTMDALREESGFARATVSEAVRLLRDRGVVEIRPGRGGGLFVAAAGPVVRLRRTLLSIEEEPRAVLDAIELREHLECFVDLGAARYRTPQDVRELRACVRAMRAAVEWADFMQANWALHERIAQIGPNLMARAVYVGTLGHLAATSSSMMHADPDGQSSYQDERYQVHEDLVAAIAAGDEVAVRAAVARHNVTDPDLFRS